MFYGSDIHVGVFTCDIQNNHTNIGKKNVDWNDLGNTKVNDTY